MRRSRWLLDAWSLGLAIVLVGTLAWRSGLPVSRDAVFAPDPPWTWQLWGIGGAAPRAVPVDLLVTAATQVLGAGIVARMAVIAPLVIAGCAAHRLVRSHGPFARAFAASLAILNPLTVERLALGQWALMWTWAALWLYPLVWARTRRGGARGAGALVLVAACGSITPSGGLMMLAVAIAVATADQRRGRWWPPAAVLLLQAPWIVAGFVGGSSHALDPEGFRVFALRDETGWGGPWGHLVTAVSLGGIWDTLSVPASRSGVTVVVVSAVWLVLAAAGLGPVRASASRLVDRLLVVALGGLLLALLPTVSPGRDLMVALGSSVPGMGLLRDSQKWLLPFGVLVIVCAAAGLGRLLQRVREPQVRVPLCVAVLLAPWWMLPDGPAIVHRTLAPVHYPAGFPAVADLVEDGEPGDAITVPWRSYRVLSWATSLPTYDPAGRWLATPVVTDDRLVVDDTVLTGESPRSARIGALVAQGRIDGASLAAAGVRWVLVYVDDPETADLELAGLTRRYADDDLRLYEVDSPVLVEPTQGRAAVLVASSVALAVLLVASAGTALAARRGQTRTDRP